MLKRHEQIRIHDLIKQGTTVKEISLRTGKSLGTIYKYKKLNGKLTSGKYNRVVLDSELAPFYDFLDSKIRTRNIKPTSLFFTIQKLGYRGSRKIFDDYFVTRKRELSPSRTIKRIETAPGEEAQVDWGHFGTIVVDGKKEKLYLFSYVLSYSRAAYMEFVVRQNQRTLQSCHIKAFNKLGIPRTILYDNMKTVVSHREKQLDGSRRVIYNLQFLDFARYYQFKPLACAPYYPQSKGKVESSIKLARNYFSRSTPNINETMESINERLQYWLDNIANNRVHGTTNTRPCDLWKKEKENLAFPNVPPYNTSVVRSYYTTQYGIFTYKSVVYNMGGTYARMKLGIREIEEHGLPLIELYRNNELIKILPVPSKRHTLVSAIDVTPGEISKRDMLPSGGSSKTKNRKNFDIDVQQRGENYYLNLNKQETAIYG